ncbi:MAG: DUF3352 domain-containing protein, partial [Bacteroidetes bacterium]|nr:DUF3352 domain-containing protein [Bacteroidota bacterium]
MLKKLLPFAVVLILVIPLGLFYYFFKDKTIPDNRIDAIEAIPIDAIMITESRSVASLIQLFNTQTQIRNDLILLDAAKPILESFKQLDTLLLSDRTIAGQLDQVPAVWSLHQTGDQQYEFVLVLQSNNRMSPKEMSHIITKVTGIEGDTQERTYNRSKISEISFPQAMVDKLNLALVKKYLIISSSPILVEEVIRQVKSGMSLNQSDEFRKAASVAGQNADANIYFNIKRLSLMLRNILNPGLKSYIESFSRYGSWMELDIKFKQDLLLGSGFGFSGDTLAWLDAFKNQAPQKNQLDKVLPSNTLGFMSFGIEDNERFFRELDEIYRGTDIETRRSAVYTKLSRTAGEDLRLAFSEILHQEAGLAWLPGKNGQIMPVVLMNNPSRNLASKQLMDWLQLKARGENKRIQDYRYNYSIDQDNRHFIYRMRIEGIPEMLFGTLFSDVKGKYFGFAGNYLIIAEDRKAIQDVIYYSTLNKTLSTDRVYKSVLEQISTRNNFQFYLAPNKSGALLKSKAGEQWKKYLSSNEQFTQQIGAVSLQIQARNNNYYHTAFIKFSEAQTDQPETAWDSRLDTTLNFKPVFTVNHNTKAKEIVVQDEQNNIYLINTSGVVLWKIRLEEAIL